MPPNPAPLPPKDIPPPFQGLSDAIKAAIAPFMGETVTPDLIAKIKAIIAQAISSVQGYTLDISVNEVVNQTQVYLEVQLMVDSTQQQLDALKQNVAGIQQAINALQNSANNLVIGQNVQGFNQNLNAIAQLALTANKMIGTDASNAIALLDYHIHPAGMVIMLPFDAKSAGWTANGALLTDPAGWLWYVPDGSLAIGNNNPKLRELFMNLWGTGAYGVTDSTGKATQRGASAIADWGAGVKIVVPDFRGRSLVAAGASTLANSTPRLVGTVWGQERLALENLPAHHHNLSVVGISATGLNLQASSGIGAIAYNPPNLSSVTLFPSTNPMGTGTGAQNIVGTTGTPGNRSSMIQGSITGTTAPVITATAGGDNQGAIWDTPIMTTTPNTAIPPAPSNAVTASAPNPPNPALDPSKAYYEIWWVNAKA